LPKPIEGPREVACVLSAESWPHEAIEDVKEFSGARHLLRFEAGGRAFARVHSGTDVKLELPVALASAGGKVTLDANGVVVSGHLEAAEMPLYPATAFVMSGVLIPNHDRRISWRSAKPGVVVVAAGPIPRLRAVDVEFVAEQKCKDIGIGPKTIDADAIERVLQTKVTWDEPARPWPWMKSGKATLSAEPGGDVIAEVDVVEPRDDTLLIHPPIVLGTKKGQTRILLRTYGGVVFGWVPNGQVERSTRSYVDLSHDNSNYLVRVIVAEGPYVTCNRDVPLVADIRSARRLVGTIRAGTHFDLGRTIAGWTEIHPHVSAIAVEEGATLLAREADLAGCASVPSRSAPRTGP
jgi:hypothetical protein